MLTNSLTSYKTLKFTESFNLGVASEQLRQHRRKSTTSISSLLATSVKYDLLFRDIFVQSFSDVFLSYR